MVNQSRPAALPESRTVRKVGVLQAGGGVALALEALGAERGGKVGVEHHVTAAQPILELRFLPLGQLAKSRVGADRIEVRVDPEPGG
jgi:hypothetical protein